jgi:hypothetical protein
MFFIQKNTFSQNHLQHSQLLETNRQQQQQQYQPESVSIRPHQQPQHVLSDPTPISSSNQPVLSNPISSLQNISYPSHIPKIPDSKLWHAAMK